MLNRELSLTFTSESDIIKLQRYELYDNRYRIFGNIASFIREVLFIVDFKENIKRIWGTTTKKKIVISAAALAVVAAGGITTGVVVNHQKDSNQSISVDAEIHINEHNQGNHNNHDNDHHNIDIHFRDDNVHNREAEGRRR